MKNTEHTKRPGISTVSCDNNYNGAHARATRELRRARAF